MEDKRNGISLIVLVITIVVIIILAGAAILTLVNNNPIETASKAGFLNNARSYETELQLYQQKQYTDRLGQYSPTTLQADASSVTYAGKDIEDKTIYDIIPSLNQDEKYKDKFIILDGRLVYSGVEDKEINWLDGIDIKTSTSEPEVFFSEPIIDQLGKTIKYTVRFSSNYPLSKISLEGNVKVVDQSNVDITNQPNISIGQLTVTNSDKVRTVEITVNTSTLGEETYRLAIKAGAVKNSNNVFNTKDVISDSSFSADNVAPINPNMTAEPTSWTNGNVQVTITYTEDSTVKEYSTDGTTWNTYSNPIVVSDNNVTVYARATDASGNQSGQSTLTISNIDKTAPTIAVQNGGAATSNVTVTATASDVGGSGLNTNSYQYSKDNGVTWTASTNAASYTFNGLTTGTYECKAKVMDNAGNITISDVVSITTTAIGTISMVANPTSWTNGNVTVTCSYPAEIVTKQYSLDGSTWNEYTSELTMMTNGIVYARGYDAGNNQTAQASINISKIDKTVPTVSSGNGGATTSSVTVTATASDAGGSGLNANSYQYSKDNGVTWTSATNATSYTFSSLTSGTYQCKVKVSDNAGNSTISTATSIPTIAVGAITMGASPSGWTNGNVIVTITYPSEIVTKQYSLDGINWNTYTSAVLVTANGTVYARGYDAANNQTAGSTITISNIDRTVPSAPTVNLNGYISGTWTSGNVTVTFNSTDSQSGIQKYQMSGDGGVTWYDIPSPWTISSDWQCNIYARAVDNAGNISGNSVEFIIRRNSTPPSISLSNTEDTADPVTVTITYPITAVTKKYRINSGSWTNYSSPFQITSDCTIDAISYDAFSNPTTVTSYAVHNIYRILSSQNIFDDSDPGLYYWASQGGSITHELASDQKHSGLYSIKVANVWSAEQTITVANINYPISINAGDTYWLSTYCRNSDTSTIGFNVWGFDSVGNRTIITAKYFSSLPANTWNYLTCLFTVPAGYTSIYFDWIGANMRPNQPIWWDYASVEKVSK